MLDRHQNFDPYVTGLFFIVCSGMLVPVTKESAVLQIRKRKKGRRYFAVVTFFRRDLIVIFVRTCPDAFRCLVGLYKYLLHEQYIVQAKERKKRAEKNRELGVKRLKLQPLQKPKPVAYCRHYLNGKCNLVCIVFSVISFVFHYTECLTD